jgi:hypothetical protein
MLEPAQQLAQLFGAQQLRQNDGGFAGRQDIEPGGLVGCGRFLERAGSGEDVAQPRSERYVGQQMDCWPPEVEVDKQTLCP